MPGINMVKTIEKSLKKKKLKKMKVEQKTDDKNLSAMSFDGFMNQFDDEKTNLKSPKTKKVKKKIIKKEVKVDDNSDDSDVELDPIAHKKSLSFLKNTDPEFYKYLEENDKKLLNFNLDEIDNEDDDELPPQLSDLDASGIDDDDDNIHRPLEKLEQASDESDFEPDDVDKKSVKSDRKITLKLLQQWRNDLRTDTSSKTIISVIKAFRAALLTVSSDEEQKSQCSDYIVEGSAVFNGVIQICVLDLQPAIKQFLKISPGSKQPPHKCKKFPKIKVNLKNYISDLVKLLGGVTSNNILTVLLKHLHHMSPMVVSFTSVTNKLLKRLIQLWGTQEDTVRVLAFLSILRITNNQRATYLNSVLKKMYMTYVINAKFVSPSTLPGINFMRHSLVEMYALDLNVSYQHVFLYIRQLAIHLRNAITLKQKENIQAVYNWQYINSIHLWAELLAATNHKPQLQQLIYPLVQICIGTIKLIPTVQYYPLRFHCIDILTQLSHDSGIYIPVLPFIYEILSTFDFGKKHKKISMKPIEFTCILRLSKSQLSENGCKDTVIEQIYTLLIKYLTGLSHSLAFPDLVLPLMIELKKFIKNCTVANYCKKMRQILEKIEENNKMIENERKTFTATLSDQKQIQSWEIQVKNTGTPLMKFYENWKKINEINKRKKATKNDEIAAEYHLPTINRRNIKRPVDDGPVELFPSDSENDMNEIPNLGSKPKRSKRPNKKSKLKIDNQLVDDNDTNENDIVIDTVPSDW